MASVGSPSRGGGAGLNVFRDWTGLSANPQAHRRPVHAASGHQRKGRSPQPRARTTSGAGCQAFAVGLTSGDLPGRQWRVKAKPPQNYSSAGTGHASCRRAAAVNTFPSIEAITSVFTNMARAHDLLRGVRDAPTA
jgi:hypothetical protein